MLRSRSSVDRSTTEWGGRIMLALIATGLGYGAVSHSYAYSIRRSAPERAHRLAPGDGRITALLSEQRSGTEATAADRAAADRVARMALSQDATAVSAAATLGINAALGNATGQARRWFNYAQRLSRRDLRTQLWFIEDSVTRNDIPGALHHYDIALRTSRVANDLLLPVLSAAISTPEVRAAMVDKLSSHPIWTASFIGFAAVEGPDPQATAQLFRALPASVLISDDARAVLLDRLVRAGKLGEAWDFYQSVHPGVRRDQSRDADFIANPSAPSLFDWNAINDDSVTATIQRGASGGVATFEAVQTAGGVALRQAQMLPPGNYTLMGQSSEIAQPAGSRPYWSLSCANGQELSRIDLPDSVQMTGRFGGRFRVPAGCPLQYLQLIVRPSDVSAGVRGQIDNVQIAPVN